MRKQTALQSMAMGVVLGATMFGATAAYADMPVFDVTVDGILTTINGVVQSGLNAITSALGVTGPIAVLLQQGFTQEANYQKAQVGANQQITDASNTAMARFQRDMRNAQTRDEQTPNPMACAALDNGQTVTAASGAAWKVAKSIADVTDARGEALPNQPAYYGQGQAVAAINQLHLSRYCSPTEAQAGLCTLSQTPDADQRASSLFGPGTYDGQTGINAANDFVTNLVQPVVPAALRGDQLTSVTGQDAAAQRRAYNARMSLAHLVTDYAMAIQTPSVPLTAAQQQQMQNEGLTPLTTGSWYQAVALEVDRRVSDVNWAAQLQQMPPASVEREIAQQLALSNYLQFQNFLVALYNAVANAAQLAATTDKTFKGTTPMPSPSMAAN